MDLLQQLTQKEVETAFKIVQQSWQGERPLKVPEILHQLTLQDWTALSKALALLEQEKELSVVH